MSDDRELSELIGQIYDAALEPDAWPDVLSKAAPFVGGHAAALFSKNAGNKSGVAVYDHGIDARYRQLYFEYYIKLDPATTGQFFADIDEPIATADLVPYDEFLETRFYKEWAKPQNLVDFVAAVLDKSATNAAMFGVFRHERDGVVDPPARQRMRLIVPHVRRAVLIGRLIDLKMAEAATLGDVLQGISAGMFPVGADGRLVHANAAGEVMLEAGDVITNNSGRFTATDPQVDQTLRDIFTEAGGGDAAIGIKGIAVPMAARSGERHVAHVLPLTSGERRRAGASYAAAAAVFVRKAALEVASPPEVVARTYGLTPTELRVLMAIVEVGGVPEVAVALGVAETTVKTHLGRLFEKTGTSRQADLVKLVAGFANPLVD